jgi:hypothetical protein
MSGNYFKCHECGRTLVPRGDRITVSIYRQGRNQPYRFCLEDCSGHGRTPLKMVESIRKELHELELALKDSTES